MSKLKSETEQESLLHELHERVAGLEKLNDDPTFFSDRSTLLRYLKARDFDLNESEKLLRGTIEWRRKTKPFAVDCKWCNDAPGYHSMRQIGFDETGRPVIYSCFAQAINDKNLPEDSIAHVTYLVENAKVTMPNTQQNWVFIMDCTGLTLPACSPKLGYGVMQVMSNHYPERLGLAICINHSPVFHGVWKATKGFLHPNTVSKMQLVRSKKKMLELFEKHFSTDLITWLFDEINLNKIEPLPASQIEFWRKPDAPGIHDPRGSKEYINKYIEPLQKSLSARKTILRPPAVHRPHPNIVAFMQGKIAPRPQPKEASANATARSSGSSFLDVPKSWFGRSKSSESLKSAEPDSDFEDLSIDDEFAIPEGAAKINTS